LIVATSIPEDLTGFCA